MEFGERLKNLRTSRGLAQADVATRADVSLSYYHQLEAGRSQPTLEIVRNLAIALSVSADELAFDPEERKRRGGDSLSHLISAVAELNKADRDALRRVIESVIYRHEAEVRRAARKRPGPAPKAKR